MEKENIAGNEVVNHLFELFVYIAQQKPNKRTKTPSVTFTQEEMIEVLKHINLIASHLGKSFVVNPDEDGMATISVVDFEEEKEHSIEA